MLVAMEKDVASSELLGTAKPIPWEQLCQFEGPCDHDVDFLDRNGQKTGNIVFTSEFKWDDYVPPKPSD